MDRRERAGDPSVVLLAALQGWQAQIWTALPAVVVDAGEGHVPFNPAERKVTVKATIQVRAQNTDGTYTWIEIPPLLDVPVLFPGAGGCTITFPIKAGDEGLVVFSSRCIDAWWQQSGVQPQMEFRMHDLSDAIFIPGLNSKPRVIPAISTGTAQFRSDTGATYVEVDPGDGFVRVITPGDVNVEAGGDITAMAGGAITANAGTDITATAAGEITLNAGGNLNLNGTLIINGHAYLAHKHDEVKAGPDVSGGVVP